MKIRSASARSQEPGARSQKARIALVDELAALEIELEAGYAKFTAKAQRVAELHATIVGWYDKCDASTTYVAEGVTAGYRVSARSLKTTVSYPAVIRTLGSVKFMAIATVTLDKLKKAAGDQYALCVTSSRTGSRFLTAVSK